MKLAICLTGFLRRAHKSSRYIWEQLYAQYDCDVYVATWNIRYGWQNYAGREEIVTEEMIKNFYGDRVKGIWIGEYEKYEQGIGYEDKPIFKKLDRPGDIFDVNERAQKLLELNQPQRHLNQWYVVGKCWELVKQNSAWSTAKYDVVYKCRADLSVDQQIPVNCSSTGNIHVGAHFASGSPGNYYTIDDKLAWGTMHDMNIYMEMGGFILDMYKTHNIDISHSEHMPAWYLQHYWKPSKRICVHNEFSNYYAPTED